MNESDRPTCAGNGRIRVRPAEARDDADVFRMAERFLETSAYRGQLVLNREHLAIVVSWLRSSQLLLVAYVDGRIEHEVIGMVGMALTISPLTGEPIAAECCWWVDEEFRGTRAAVLLWDGAEAWAHQKNVNAIQMIEPGAAPAVGSMYHRRGYVPLETVWQKRVK